MRATIIGGLLALLLAWGSTGSACAQEKKAILGTFGGTPLIKLDRAGDQTSHRRAGCPHAISCLAAPSETPRYQGGWIGGGTAIGGDPRTLAEGTWGWDYPGFKFPARIWLNWSHGRRYQGGAGAYKVDGPHLLH